MCSLAVVKKIDSQSALQSICASENFEFVCPLKNNSLLLSYLKEQPNLSLKLDKVS